MFHVQLWNFTRTITVIDTYIIYTYVYLEVYTTVKQVYIICTLHVHEQYISNTSYNIDTSHVHKLHTSGTHYLQNPKYGTVAKLSYQSRASSGRQHGWSTKLKVYTITGHRSSIVIRFIIRLSTKQKNLYHECVQSKKTDQKKVSNSTESL
jgi:hypothetical protein